MRDTYLDMYLDMTGIAKVTKEKCWNVTLNKFSTVMTSPGPAFQECTRSCHENVPAPKAVSSYL